MKPAANPIGCEAEGNSTNEWWYQNLLAGERSSTKNTRGHTLSLGSTDERHPGSIFSKVTRPLQQQNPFATLVQKTKNHKH